MPAVFRDSQHLITSKSPKVPSRQYNTTKNAGPEVPELHAPLYDQVLCYFCRPCQWVTLSSYFRLQLWSAASLARPRVRKPHNVMGFGISMEPAAQHHENCSKGSPRAAFSSAEPAANSPGEGGATWMGEKGGGCPPWFPGTGEGGSTTDLPGKHLRMLPGFG